MMTWTLHILEVCGLWSTAEHDRSCLKVSVHGSCLSTVKSLSTISESTGVCRSVVHSLRRHMCPAWGVRGKHAHCHVAVPASPLTPQEVLLLGSQQPYQSSCKGMTCMIFPPDKCRIGEPVHHYQYPKWAIIIDATIAS